MRSFNEDFIERIIKSESTLISLTEDNLTDSMIKLMVNGLVLVQTDLNDEMPLLCKLVRVRLTWYYVVPAELIKP